MISIKTRANISVTKLNSVIDCNVNMDVVDKLDMISSFNDIT